MNWEISMITKLEKTNYYIEKRRLNEFFYNA